MKEILAFIASLLAISGYLPYLIKSIKNKVTPHPYTWFVWSIISAITLIGQIVKGAGIGALPTAIAEILTISIFFASLKHGFIYIKKSDTYFLILSLLGLIPWIIFRDPTISVIIAVTVDVIAFTPTFRKSWEHPATESKAVYSTNVIRHIISLFSLRTYNIATTWHSMSMIITNTATTLILQFSNKKTKISN